MKNDFNKYGRKITEAEYVAAVSALYSDNLPEAQYRKAESNLTIDWCIGVNYPAQKRDMMHNARERATRRFLYNPMTLFKAAFHQVAQKLRPTKGVPDFDEGSFNFATKVMAQEFAREKELDIEDISAFVGPEVGAYLKAMQRKGSR